MSARTAAALIVGNEVLTGKVEEQNLAVLARELFGLGVTLRRAIVCPDEIDVIAADVDALRRSHDFVFTSGGIGPTHDDVTIAAVAKAFGRELTRSEEYAMMIRRHFGDRVTENHLLMAVVPEGATLVRSGQMPWPTIAIENVYVLPGVPEVFRAKLPVLRDSLRGGAGFVSRAVYTHCEEPEIATPLAEIARAFPDVMIGSYLKWRGTEYTTKLTFDGRDPQLVARALEAFVATLDPKSIVRID